MKGARVYYLRNIFHAWGDETCTKILLNAKAGLTEQSVLLIDEIVLPERDATAQGAQHDIEVMICVGMYTDSRSLRFCALERPSRGASLCGSPSVYRITELTFVQVV